VSGTVGFAMVLPPESRPARCVGGGLRVPFEQIKLEQLLIADGQTPVLRPALGRGEA
jgi:hypothetical protein